MNLKPILLGTLAYTAVTFPLAVVWHIGLFEEAYRQFGYFGDDPSFLLGFLAILLQGVALSAGYGFARIHGSHAARGMKYAAFTGAFFWTSHVLALTAKNPAAANWTFVAMETVYLVGQFGIFGALIGSIHARAGGTTAR